MQTATSVSQWIKQITQPDHPYYHPTQVLLFAGCGYIGTHFCTSISPIKGMVFAPLVYAINQYVGPYFLRHFEPHQDVPLVPLACGILHYSVAILLTKLTFSIARKPLSFKEITQITTSFLITLWVLRFALRYWRQQIKPYKEKAITPKGLQSQ